MGGNLHLFGSRIKPMQSFHNLSAKRAPMSPCLLDVFPLPSSHNNYVNRWDNLYDEPRTVARAQGPRSEKVYWKPPLYTDDGVREKPTAPSCLSALLDGKMKRWLWHFSEYEFNWHSIRPYSTTTLLLLILSLNSPRMAVSLGVALGQIRSELVPFEM